MNLTLASPRRRRRGEWVCLDERRRRDAIDATPEVTGQNAGQQHGAHLRGDAEEAWCVRQEQADWGDDQEIAPISSRRTRAKTSET